MEKTFFIGGDNIKESDIDYFYKRDGKVIIGGRNIGRISVLDNSVGDHNLLFSHFNPSNKKQSCGCKTMKKLKEELKGLFVLIGFSLLAMAISFMCLCVAAYMKESAVSVREVSSVEVPK